MLLLTWGVGYLQELASPSYPQLHQKLFVLNLCAALPNKKAPS